MRAMYVKEPDCVWCMYTFPDMPVERCIDCEKNRTKSVEILKFVSGPFGDRAIVKFNDGRLESVPISSLTVKDKEEEDN